MRKVMERRKDGWGRGRWVEYVLPGMGSQERVLPCGGNLIPRTKLNKGERIWGPGILLPASDAGGGCARACGCGRDAPGCRPGGRA